MARIAIHELISLVKASPSYLEQWELDVPAEQGLYVRFAEGKVEHVYSEVLELANGSELVIDRDPDGKVVGIEIV